MSFFPLEISRSGDYVAGEVILPRPIEAANRPALWTPAKALWTPGGRIGREDDFEMSGERAWAAIQLDKSRRYHEMVAELVQQGKLTLRPGLPGFGQLPASAPVTSWSLDGLHFSKAMALLETDRAVALPQKVWDQLDRAGSAAALLRILEPVAQLPQRIWDQLDEFVGQEKGRSH